MGEFVGEKAAPGRMAGLVALGAEDDFAADGVCSSAQPERGTGRRLTAVDSDVAEIICESLPHLQARHQIKWPTGVHSGQLTGVGRL
jgi:hypothetical protein